uniref:RGS domain-containing protein n=1 Tax=Cyprinus carpio TaxID=7962 RepID=A0A8C2J441_CYPCA
MIQCLIPCNRSSALCGDVGVVFSEDTPRPPVPGEEGCEGGVYSSKTASHWSEAPVASVRRSDVDLGFEPEGSAPPDGPYEPWAETLLTLLEDRDGTALFLRFLQTLGCAPLLEFWFACSGFQKVPEDATERRLKLARGFSHSVLFISTSLPVTSSHWTLQGFKHNALCDAVFM